MDQFIQKSTEYAGISVIGFWLLFLYPLLTYFVVGTLSSYQFQDKILNIKDSNNAALSIPSLMRKAEKLKEIQDSEEGLNEKIRKLKTEIEENINKNRELKEQLSRKYDESDLQYYKLDSLVSAHEKSGKGNAAELKGKKAVEKAAILSAAGQQDIKEIYEKYKNIINDIGRNEVDVRSSNRELARVDKENSKLIDQYQNKVGQLNVDAQELTKDSKVGDMLGELDVMSRLKLDFFATMPSQILVLLLTLAMGALGSLLYITQDFFDSNTNHSFSWYLFRPFLGMVTAIAIYVLAKAGQITISDAGISNGLRENLNPFFISFLAIISGLLSENAISKIRASAKPFFSGQGASGPQRWGVGLAGIINSKKKDVSELAGYLDSSNEDIEQWIAGSKAAPDEIQKIIASWLGVPRRELFTDIKPD